MKALTGTGSGPILAFALQQIHEFLALGEDFAMQYTGTEYLGEWNGALKTAALELIPPEERLRGLSAEDVVRGLSEQELTRLRELLERKRESETVEVVRKMGRLTPSRRRRLRLGVGRKISGRKMGTPNSP